MWILDSPGYSCSLCSAEAETGMPCEWGPQTYLSSIEIHSHRWVLGYLRSPGNDQHEKAIVLQVQFDMSDLPAQMSANNITFLKPNQR